VLADLSLPFVQRGLVAVLLLAVAAGLLGTWIVLRGLAFFAHAVSTAAFPGLVVADGLGLAASLGAFGSAIAVAAGVAWLSRRRPGSRDASTALVLVGALALGVVLASDVFATQAGVETLLFGSLLAVDGADLVLAAAAAVLVPVATLALGPRWLRTGFDGEGARGGRHDLALLALVALVAVATLAVVGALLVTALLVVPAATTRLLVDRLRPWQLATVALAAGQGVLGLWLALWTNAPPGATIAVVAGTCFLLALAVRALRGRRVLAAAAAAAALGAAGCGGGDEGGGAEGDGVRVVASTPQVADIARQVAGDGAQITTLLRPGADPHDYEPRPEDVRAVAGADLVLASGLGLDPWVADVVQSAGGGARLVAVGDAVPVKLEGSHDDDHDDGDLGRPHEGVVDHGDDEDKVIDPHWWHEPRNVVAAAQLVGRELRADAAPYVAEVQRTAGALRACFSAVPAEDRKLVTDHDAFAYLAEAYDLEVVGAVIPSTTSQAQPSAGDLAELADTVDREGVRAVFPAQGVSPDLARTIARRTGAEVGDPLWADALDEPGRPAATLLGAAAANADALVRGFTGGERGCEVPPA
jgi:ABC-type Zn uptake system ZnuABC Zn-binding protein ZnuA/ABC-type Mn2+/Zn2+ transport system permease subunit